MTLLNQQKLSWKYSHLKRQVSSILPIRILGARHINTAPNKKSAVVSTAVAYLAMAIYRHIDVRKYAKISYSINDLLLAIIAVVVVSIRYYSNDTYLLIAGMAVAVVYAIVQNWKLLKKFLKR